MTEDKALLWSNRIRIEVGRAAKSVMDTLVAVDRAGFKNMTLQQRAAVHDAVAQQIAGVMGRLGTFVLAGAQDSIEVTLDNFKAAAKVDIKLMPKEDTPEVLAMLGANRHKQAVLVFTNQLAYSQAREALTTAIHREQTDWVSDAQDEQIAADAPNAAAEVSISAYADGQSTGDDHGESQEGETPEEGTASGHSAGECEAEGGARDVAPSRGLEAGTG